MSEVEFYVAVRPFNGLNTPVARFSIETSKIFDVEIYPDGRESCHVNGKTVSQFPRSRTTRQLTAEVERLRKDIEAWFNIDPDDTAGRNAAWWAIRSKLNKGDTDERE